MNPIRKLKIMPLVVACVLFVLGVIVVFISDVVGTNMPAILGTIILGVGITRVVYGFLTYREELDARNNITLGVLDIIWGILMLILVNNNAAFVLLFGLWCLIGAVLEIAEMIKNIVAKLPWVGLMVDAIINLCFGVVMLVNPFSTMPAYIRFVGIYLLLNAFTVVLITLITTKRIEVVKETVSTVETVVKNNTVEAVPSVNAEAIEVKDVQVEQAPIQEVVVEDEQKQPVATKRTTTTKKTTATKKATTTKTTTKKTSTTPKKTSGKTSTSNSGAKKTTAKKTTAKKAE